MPPFYGPNDANLNPEYPAYAQGGYYGGVAPNASYQDEAGNWHSGLPANATMGWFSNLPGGGDPYALVEASRAEAARLGQKMIQRPGLDASREPPNVPGPSPWPGGSVSASVMPRSYSGGASSYSGRAPTPRTGYSGYSVQGPQVGDPAYLPPPGGTYPGGGSEQPGQPGYILPPRPQYPGGPVGVAPGASTPGGAQQGYDPAIVAGIQSGDTRYVTDSNERIQQLVLAQRAAENAGNWKLAREIEGMRAGVQNRQIDVNEALGQAQLLLNRELGMGTLEMQKLGITTAADTARQGYVSNENIAGMQNATARAGMATNASLTREGYGLQRDLGMAGIGVQREGIQSGERVGMAGVGVQREGIQSGERLGNRGYDVQAQLGNRGLDIQNRGLDVELELGRGGLSNQRFGIESGERLGMRGYDVQEGLGYGGLDLGYYQTDSGERIANRGFQSQDYRTMADLANSDDFLAFGQAVNNAPIDVSTSPWAQGGAPAPSWQRMANSSGFMDSRQATGSFGQAAQPTAPAAPTGTFGQAPTGQRQYSQMRGPNGSPIPAFAQQVISGDRVQTGAYGGGLNMSAQQRNALQENKLLGAYESIQKRAGMDPERAFAATQGQASAFAGRAPTRVRSWGR